tara:strand:+ start:2248 stop:2571 length:324 start_codon:yes stop_codon:yes gene_type:complete
MSIGDSTYKQQNYEIAECEKRLRQLKLDAIECGSDLDQNVKDNNKKSIDISVDKLLLIIDKIQKDEERLPLLKKIAGWKYDNVTKTFVEPDEYEWILMSRDMALGRI